MEKQMSDMTPAASAPTASRPEWPPILDRYLREIAGTNPEHEPRRTTRHYHGREVSLWYGRVHVDDVDGWVENIRLKHYLRRWRVRQGDMTKQPTTQEIYEIMQEADDEESAQSRKPFQLERMARNIASNGVQEPIFIHVNGNRGTLWDGNRRRYGVQHIMTNSAFSSVRNQARWIPAYVHVPSGNPETDAHIKQAVLTELNFKEKDHIPWPSYVKAEEVFNIYQRLTAEDPSDPKLKRMAKDQIAQEFGLSSWRQADRWIKMFGLASQFKEYHEEEFARPEVDVELKIQDNFEYFDELSKPGVWGSLENDPDARDEVFGWLWDDKFKSFVDVRSVPKILKDPEARKHANADDDEGVKRAIDTVISNDPVRVKDKSAANERIRHFAVWLDSFKREDYRRLTPESLGDLRQIVADTVKILQGLQSGAEDGDPAEGPHAAT
jgi:hypothetical protein